MHVIFESQMHVILFFRGGTCDPSTWVISIKHAHFILGIQDSQVQTLIIFKVQILIILIFHDGVYDSPI
jgi:hypothetical protein